MNKRVDCHTHILPGIDDGAATPSEALEMLCCLARQGVSTVVLTPHYVSDGMSLDVFLQKRAAAMELLQEERPPIEVLLGSEVLLSEALFNNRDLQPLCIEGTSCMLVELPSYEMPFTDKVTGWLQKLISIYEITPVIAHAERYTDLLRHEKKLWGLNDDGCLVQINLSSLQKGRLLQKKLLKWIDCGWVQLLGTDCHHITVRPPEYAEPLEVIVRRFGERVAEELCSAAAIFQSQSRFGLFWDDIE